MNESTHAGRSPEFLSRLYDGEVDAAERSAFEAHRSACEECRRAADTFAATLAAFRSSPTAPPAADLSVRILRKIRAQSPARRPFGVMFGIDIRWAGIFVAALLVVLLSAPVLLRRPAPPAPKEPSAIPARILDAPASSEAAQAQAARSEAKKSGAPPAPAAPAAKDERPAAQPEGAPQPARPVEGPTADEKRRFASAPRSADNAASALRRQAAAAEPSGGEAGATGAVDAETASLRITIRVLDGHGPAPALVSRPIDERLAELRGREFLLVVESQGSVREAQPSSGNGRDSVMKSRPADAPAAAGPADLLREFRFGPGDRLRRLLVRIE